uniref:RNA-directed RNA polymerase L n=1 Tax=Phytophthora palustris bunya-like virus 9-1 TaxID=2976288 RepID=A0A9E9BXB5_9VIRU|nr:RNA-dependent RNA polymerase [Phytophthora palustris bunya-like virus 9-1]
MTTYQFTDGQLILSLQSPSPNGLNTYTDFQPGHFAESLMDRVSYRHLSPFLAPGTYHCFDFGESADNFLRGLNHLIELYRIQGIPLYLFTIENWLRMMDKPTGVYITDEDIDNLAWSTHCSIFLIHQENDVPTLTRTGIAQIPLFFEKIGDVYRPVIGPFIYEVILAIKDSFFATAMKLVVPEIRDVEEDDAVIEEEAESEGSYEVEDETESPAELEGSSSGEEITEQLEILPTNPQPQVLFSYLCDFGSMIADDPSEVLDAFKMVHYSVVNYIIESDNNKTLVDKYLMKMYYKCRHNTFAFICSFKGESVIDTDASLRKYIDSDRTPDCIIEDEETIHLVEFTVSNRYDMVDFNKGGGILDVKYTKEAGMISEATGKKCRVVIVPAVLDEYNIAEVTEIMSPLNKVREGLLKDFYTISNKYKGMISNAYISSQSKSTGLSSVQGNYEMPPLMKTEMFDSHFVSTILKNWSWMSNFVASLIDRYGPDYKLGFIYEKSNGRMRIIERPNKIKSITAGDCFEILNMGDLSGVLKKVNFRSEGKEIGSKEMRGDVAVTTSASLSRRVLPKLDFRPILDRIYSRTTPASKDDYRPYDMLPESNEQVKVQKVLFDKDYYSRLLNNDFSNLMNTNCTSLLANNEITKDYINTVTEMFSSQYTAVNSDPNQKFNPKQSFILPMLTVPATSADMDHIDNPVLKAYLSYGTGTYTKAVLRKGLEKKFHVEAVPDARINAARDLYSNARSNYTASLAKLGKSSLRRWTMMDDSLKMKLMDPKQRMLKAQRDYISLLKKAKHKKVRVVKVNCNKRSLLRKDFELEMSHFKKENKGLKGVGKVEDPASLNSFFQKFLLQMKEPGFSNTRYPPLFNKERGPGPQFLTEDKDYYTSRWQTFYDQKYKGTMLEQLTVVGENLARLLFNESVKTYNRDFCKIDNLGFEQVIVIVKGGKKAYSRNTSKLFRVGFECDPSFLKYLGYQENRFFEIIEDSGRTYVYTPWSIVHLDILYDWFSLRYRTFSSVYTSYVREGSPDSLTLMSIFPALLSFHNRRKTEQLLHNIRYLIVNVLGMYANLKGIIQGFATFNHSYLDAWLKERILKNYNNFAITMHGIVGKESNLNTILSSSGLKDIWFDQPFLTSDQLTSFIYITYSMTKSPVNASLEQANNLKEILKDIAYFNDKHGDVDKMNDTGLHIDVMNFKPTDYDDDFSYDPTFCQYLGFHLAGFLKTRADPNEINSLWNRCSSKGLSDIANSNGLRGFEESNFYGKKGYEVVYDYIIKCLDEKEIELESLVEQYLSMDYESAQDAIKIDGVNRKELTLDKLTFHIVHKIQRGGGREIFCMDLVTKAYQNPLESFFKGLCRMIPNEFISVSSNKRHSIIHTNFFERTPSPWIKNIVRWVLDCRRWAPHSVFQKYMHFIHGMSPILPEDMVKEFEEFGDLMMEKRFITREHVYNTIKGNESYSVLLKNLKKSKEAGTYQATVKFSFVMGIFNYLSSMMHAANQMLATEVIMNYNLKHSNGLVIMDPKCHSDDSVVTSYHESPDSIRPSVLLYDWLLKCANHMLSIKKSQVNKNVYLEFLSILYLFDKFVPVSPKFLGSIPFKPTDTGYSSDVTFAVTQCIEIIMNGGTIEEGFLLLKMTEKYIQSIYNLPSNPSQPYNFLGNIDSHPLELLLAGAQCEIYKFMTYKPLSFWASMSLLNKMGLIETDVPTDLSVKWDMGSTMSPRLKKKYSRFQEAADKLSFAYPWTMENCKLGNDFLNVLWYVNKLRDPKYYSSMIHEPDSRRFTRAFGSYRYRNILGKNGSLYSVVKLSALLNNVDLYKDKLTPEVKESTKALIEYLCDDLSYFYESIKGAKWSDEKPNGFKDKPVYFNFTNPQLQNIRMTASEYVSYVREPEAYKLLGKRNNPVRQVNQITEYCRTMGVNPDTLSSSQLYTFVNKILNAGEHNFRIISPVPGDTKLVDTFSSVLVLLSHGSVRHKIRPIISTSTSGVDWRRRVVNGRVPESVMKTLEVTNVIEMAKKFGVEDRDIFKCDLNTRLEQSKNEIPTSWRPLLHATLSEHKIPLIEEQYWIYWIKDQVKNGRNWYGKGEIILGLPEVKMKVMVNNGTITEIITEGEVTCFFSATTNWFLTNFFNMSGMRLPMDLSRYQNPNDLVFGYNSQKARYGLDYPLRFDSVFPFPVLNSSITESFMYSTCERVKKGRYWNYIEESGRAHKIEFFIPSYEKPVIDMSNYVEKSKIRALLKDEKIRDFCFKLSVEMREEYTFRTKDVVDTIGYSRLYKILYSNNDFPKLFRGESVEDIFLESIMEWKSHNEDYRFPSLDELKELAKRSDIPQMPGKIHRLLNKKEISTITDEEFSYIISQLYELQPSERVKYLLSVFPMLSESERVYTLTLSNRSSRIYGCISFIGVDWYKLLNPLISLVRDSVDANTSHSDILLGLKTRFSVNVPESEIFMLIISRVVLNGFCAFEVMAEADPTVGLFMDVIEELLDNGLIDALQTMSGNEMLLRTIEFKGHRDDIMKMFMDLLDNLYIARMGKKPIETKRDFIRVEMPQIMPYKKHILKLLSNSPTKRIEVNFKSKGRRLNRTLIEETGTPGLPSIPFKPLGEMDQEEFEDGYDWNEDIEEDLELEEFGVAKQMAFVQVATGNWKGVCSIRGSAHTVFVKSRVVDRSFLNAHGDKTFYIPDSYHGLTDYINNMGMRLVKISESSKNVNIAGFRRISHTDIFRLECRHKSPKVVIDGVSYKKSEIIGNISLSNSVASMDSYFRRITAGSAEKEIKRIEEFRDNLEEAGVLKSPDYIEAVAEIKELVGIKEESEEEESKNSSSLDEMLNKEDLLDKIQRIIDLSDKGMDLPAVNRKISPDRMINYKEPMQLLQDPLTIGEFNALFGNTGREFESNNLRLTALTKKTKIKYMKLQVRAMAPQVRPNYIKLMGVVMSLLSDIETCASVANESHELSHSIDALFDIETEEETGDFNLMLQPLPGDINRDPDLDRLFG